MVYQNDFIPLIFNCLIFCCKNSLHYIFVYNTLLPIFAFAKDVEILITSKTNHNGTY